jgi:hypothetical protein
VVTAEVNGFNTTEGRARRGGFMEGKSRWHVTASTRRLQTTELGGGTVEGGWIQRRRSRAQATWEEGNDRWGPPIS